LFIKRTSSTHADIYIDGVDKGYSTLGNSDAVTIRRIGSRGDGYYFNGPICEVRYSSTARSDAWIKATHASLADTLLTYGSEEALTPTARPRVMVVWA